MPVQFLFNTAVTVERKSPTRDASGGQVENFAEVPTLSEIPALIQPRSGKAFASQAQRAVTVTHVVYLLDGSQVRRGDRLHQLSTGRRFVTHGIEDMAGQGVFWRVECVEVT